MKRILIILITALLVFVATLFSTGHYIENKIVQAADSTNAMIMADMKGDFETLLHMTSESVNSFLSGTFYCHYVRQDSCEIPVFTINDTDEREFPKWASASLHDFLEVNPYYDSAAFFLCDSICQKDKQYGYQANTDEGEVIFAQQKGSSQIQMSSTDFIFPETYKKLREKKSSLWALPAKGSSIDGKLVMYYVPVYCNDGRFFGVFAICLNADKIHEMIDNHLPYGKENSQMIICDKEGEIIASSPKEYERYRRTPNLYNVFLNKVEKVTRTDEGNIKSVFYQGREYYFYPCTIEPSGWSIYTFCSTNAVYKKVHEIRFMLIFTSLVGMLFMLICCGSIFFQVHRGVKAKVAMEQEAENAARMQMSILKERKFEDSAAGVELNSYILPAKSTGGDLYDYAKVGDKLVFCIGDVSGKGMPASLFMTQVVSLFRNAVRHTTVPEDIVGQINDVLSEYNPDSTFCTFFVAELEGTTLHFCNAGHNRPVIIHNSQKAEYLKVQSNLPIGYMEGFDFQSETVELQHGDSIFLYTDGVTEATSKEQQCYGDGRLLVALSHPSASEDAIKTVLDSVHMFVNGYVQSDDITMVHVKI